LWGLTEFDQTGAAANESEGQIVEFDKFCGDNGCFGNEGVNKIQFFAHDVLQCLWGLTEFDQTGAAANESEGQIVEFDKISGNIGVRLHGFEKARLFADGSSFRE
jgi:hypothetical protein